jgi:hypothetical protein
MSQTDTDFQQLLTAKSPDDHKRITQLLISSYGLPFVKSYCLRHPRIILSFRDVLVNENYIKAEVADAEINRLQKLLLVIKRFLQSYN